MAIQHFKTSEFDAAVEAAPLAMVDFWASWCGPCKLLSPVLDKVAQEFEGSVKFTKVNVDENPELAVKYGIVSIPTVMLFKGKEEPKRLIGLVDAQTLREFLA